MAMPDVRALEDHISARVGFPITFEFYAAPLPLPPEDIPPPPVSFRYADELITAIQRKLMSGMLVHELPDEDLTMYVNWMRHGHSRRTHHIRPMMEVLDGHDDECECSIDEYDRTRSRFEFNSEYSEFEWNRGYYGKDLMWDPTITF